MKKKLGPFGFSCENLKKQYNRDASFGAYIVFDSAVYVGFCIYFYKWIIGFWISTPDAIKHTFGRSND